MSLRDDRTPEVDAFVAWMDQKIATTYRGLTENGVTRRRIAWLRSIADQAEREMEDRIDSAVTVYLANRGEP